MNLKIKYLSRINDDFDTVICGLNGVIMRGGDVYKESVDALIKLYQSGKKVMLASNSGGRVKDLYYTLKKKNIPMNIFYAMITAGEVAHFYLKNNKGLGRSYYNLTGTQLRAISGLDYPESDSLIMSDFMIAENDYENTESRDYSAILEQALSLNLPFLCVGNNTTMLSSDGVVPGVGALAEKYAMMGGKVISFGKPDVKMAYYLVEEIADFDFSRCLIIGDSMSADIRMGNTAGAKTLLIADGVHQFCANLEQKLCELSESYGLQVDYCMERLQW